MSILKKGSCSSKISVSSAVYVCNECGYTDMRKSKKCPECKGTMSKVSSSTDDNSSDDKGSDIV